MLTFFGFRLVHAEPPVKPAPGSVQVMFLPPPLEDGAVHSVGVYETITGRLIRRLHEDAEDGAFTAGLNGLITSWDRKDDAGKTVPAGKYAARGWAVGEMKVEGEAILGNDWAEEDENLRITEVIAVRAVASDNGLLVLAAAADERGVLLRVSGKDGKLMWHRQVTEDSWTHPELGSSQQRTSFLVTVDGDRVWCALEGHFFELSLADGHELSRRDTTQDDRLTGTFFQGMANGNNPQTVWLASPAGVFEIDEKGSLSLESFRSSDTPAPADKAPVTAQTREDYSRAQKAEWTAMADKMRRFARRHLDVEPGQPVPWAISLCPGESRIYLKEISLEEPFPLWQRVRGLEWVETKVENGRPVSEWRTFFERSIRRPDPALGLDEKAASPVVELPLAKNPLEPGKRQRAKLRAGFDTKGAYLETADGLHLLPVSARPHLRAAQLKRDPKDPDRLLFYQFDGAAWDVFSITGVPKALMAFDAGEFELTADGERRPERPVDEPRGF